MIKEKVSRFLGLLIVTFWLMTQVYLLNKTFLDWSKELTSESFRDLVEFLIFSIQLLLGGFAYDVLKALSQSDKSWDLVVNSSKEIVFYFGLILICIIAMGNPHAQKTIKLAVGAFMLIQFIYMVVRYKQFLVEINKHLKKD